MLRTLVDRARPAASVVLQLVLLFVIASQCACASVPGLEIPTPEHPRIGCITDSPMPAAQVSRRTGNRLLPELVRVIGVTSGEDGERWMVIRGGYYSAASCAGENLHDRSRCDWQPWPKEKIQFVGCGPEVQ